MARPPNKPDESDERAAEARRSAADKNEKPAARLAVPKAPEQRVFGTITWLGEGEGGPGVNEWNGLKLKVGEPVEVVSKHMLEKAKNNRFFDVDEYDEPRRADPGKVQQPARPDPVAAPEKHLSNEKRPETKSANDPGRE